MQGQWTWVGWRAGRRVGWWLEVGALGNRGMKLDLKNGVKWEVSIGLMEAQEEDKHGLDISLTLSQETDTPKTMMEGEHTTFQGKMEKG